MLAPSSGRLLVRSFVDRHRPSTRTNDETGELAEEAARRLAAAWSHGRRLCAEVVFQEYPRLSVDPDAAARLIYEEYCQREALGEPPRSSELLQRFPQWRVELSRLIACHRALLPSPRHADLPEVGEVLGDFELRVLLGSGLRGRVYLATQRSLADRPVALKLTPGRGGEHLSLARVQHPHVVPLYAFHDFPERNLRALCMPYLGGLTLDRALARLPQRRDGREVIGVLDEARNEYVAGVAWSAARQFLGGTSYSHAVCWIIACLADALHSVHLRGHVHLDLKPSNILIADDGQPMLLDFHLARAPIEAELPLQGDLGGTAGYMSPEQMLAVAAARAGFMVPRRVEGTSDLYSLGAILLEALTGELPPSADLRPTQGDLVRVLRDGLNGCRMEAGLARIVARSIAYDPSERFQTGAEMAEALRGCIGHQPDDRPFWVRLRRWFGRDRI
ncbi:MAG: serine/threonine-protein kinase [Isosphaeraceae bacterium]